MHMDFGKRMRYGMWEVDSVQRPVPLNLQDGAVAARMTAVTRAPPTLARH